MEFNSNSKITKSRNNMSILSTEVIDKINSDYVDLLIQEARKEVEGFVMPADEYTDHRLIIARYVAAFAVNFTDWIGKTLPWARHELAQFALRDNLRCEQGQDHIGMLLNFARQAGVHATDLGSYHVSQKVAMIRNLLRDTSNAGLAGLVILSVLEETSKIFIPVLEDMGRRLGITDLTYTQVHGEADAQHSEAFIRALKAELAVGYQDYDILTRSAANAAVGLLQKIFEETTLGKYPPISVGQKVRTTQANMMLRKDWTDEGWDSKKWGMQGIVVNYHDSHGLCYEVRHDDGSVGSYDPSELEVV